MRRYRCVFVMTVPAKICVNFFPAPGKYRLSLGENLYAESLYIAIFI